MNLLLTRFSQDVDLSNTNEVKYFLVFETTDGHEVRLPVQKETTEALVKILYAKPAQKPTTLTEDVGHEDDSSEFEEEEIEKEAESEFEDEDAGEGEDLEDMEPEDGVEVVEKFVRKATPRTEDEVPSL